MQGEPEPTPDPPWHPCLVLSPRSMLVFFPGLIPYLPLNLPVHPLLDPSCWFCIWMRPELPLDLAQDVPCTSPALPCPALPCPALPCPALPCPALPCPALPSPQLPCPPLPSPPLPSPPLPSPPLPCPPHPSPLVPSPLPLHHLQDLSQISACIHPRSASDVLTAVHPHYPR